MPSLQTYTLTFNFDRAVTWYNGSQVPEEMEVTIIPLANPSFPNMGTYVGGLQSQTVLLTNTTNTVTFNLVPSNAAGLSQPVNYRAEWRQGGITGRVFSQVFAMPGQNVTWDQLADLSDFVTGTDYIQQTQIGVAGGIAALNSDGEVVDVNGVPVANAAAVTTLTSLISTETTNRTNAINALQSTLSTSLAEDITSVTTTSATNLSNAVATLNATITSNYENLASLITTEATTRAADDTAFTSEITALQSSVSTLTTGLGNAATLTQATYGGASAKYLTSAQVPPYLILTAYPVSGQGGMLALSNTSANGNLPAIHYGDVALWANGAVWMLVGNPSSPVLYPDPSQLSNWVDLTSVYAVNGLTGNVTLTPQVIGAVGVNGSYGTITMSQVTNLSSTLSNYTLGTTFATLQATVTGILNNTNYVMLDTTGPSAGYINHAKLDTNVAYVNNLNEVTLKNGTVIASGTGSVDTVNGYGGPNVTLDAADVGAIAVGGTVPESSVINGSTGHTLTYDLAQLTPLTDSRLTNARTPLTHAASHEVGGSDALLLDWWQVQSNATSTALPNIIGTLATQATTNAQAAQISTLESNVTYLLGGGSPASSPIKATWFDGPSTFTGITNPAAFQTTYGVQQKSPFGKSASDGTYYYNPAGANAGEWVYPYITPGGHLQFHQWNESNAADPTYVTSTQLATVNATIATLATTAQLSTLQTQLNAAATQSSVTAISNQLSSFATVSTVNSLQTQISNAASQASLNATNATIATLATQSSVQSLSASISGLATQSALATVAAQTTANTQALTNVATLSGSGNTVPLVQLPQIPESQIQNLTADLAARAPLSGGTIPLNYFPQIPESYIQNLTNDLAGKAPLVGGQVPSQYLPSLSITTVDVVANQAAMLALTGLAVGAICVISGTSAQGSYILANTPPSTLSNWVLLPQTQDVVSVNGQTGAVNLTAANINAMTIGQAISISQISNLQPTLNTFATTTALATAVAPLQSASQVQGTLTSSVMVKQPANYVATTAIPSLAGQQTVDGVLTPLGSVVLATTQPSSTNNGLWVVQTGAWTRTTDFTTGSYFVRGSLVFVQNGQVNANTIWQETATSAVVDTNANNWSKVMTAGGPVTYTAGNGLSLGGSNNTVFSASVVTGGGLANSSSGLALDTAVAVRKYTGYVPSGTPVATITHNLGTNDVGVWIRDMTQSQYGVWVLAAYTIQGPNSLTIEFASAPTLNQYRVLVVG